jgi:hypothetical protein
LAPAATRQPRRHVVLDLAAGDDVDLAHDERAYRDDDRERGDQHTCSGYHLALACGGFDLEDRDAETHPSPHSPSPPAVR